VRWGAPTRTRLCRETLRTASAMRRSICIDNGFYDNTNFYTVPNGHFFMLGTTATIRRTAACFSQIG